MKIFLDVGAHTGETVRAVLDPKYRFDRIFCFEPVESCRRQLARFPDPRVVVLPFGLWKETTEREIYGPGAMGASLFADMPVEDASRTERCHFVAASEWFRENIDAQDSVYMKLNCEGSECDILDDLVDTGEFFKVTQVMVDFDVRKIPSQRHREAETRKRVEESGLRNFRYCEDVMTGATHALRIQHWLRMVGANDCPWATQFRQVVYVLRCPWDLRRDVLRDTLRRGLRRVLPRRVYDGLRDLERAIRR